MSTDTHWIIKQSQNFCSVSRKKYNSNIIRMCINQSNSVTVLLNSH